MRDSVSHLELLVLLALPPGVDLEVLLLVLEPRRVDLRLLQLPLQVVQLVQQLLLVRLDLKEERKKGSASRFKAAEECHKIPPRSTHFPILTFTGRDRKKRGRTADIDIGN